MTGVRRVLVDGGSGAGKTTFARRLARRWSDWTGEEVQLVSLDSFCPGWFGLEESSRMVVTDVLRDASPGYRTWDWTADRPGQWVPLDATRPMVIEGCGAITRESIQRSQLSLWLELDEPSRRHRALSRPDGEGYEPWWECWAAQERMHWERDQPALLADFTIRPGS